MTVPFDFVFMPPLLINYVYPNKKKPSAVLMNDGGSVNIAFSASKDKFDERDLDEATMRLMEVTANIKPTCEIITSGITSG